MDYTAIPQVYKAEILEKAVINGSAEELVKTCTELGFIEMTARALGLACRFCGVETVKTLAECGATFDIPKNEGAEGRYHCYSGMKWDNYRTDFSLYLLNTTKHIKGACCCKGLKLLKQIKRDDNTALKILPDSERAKVLDYLCENADKLSFKPEEMLFYAIFARDGFIVSQLKKRGVKLSEKRAGIIANGGPITDGYWYEWTAMIGKLPDADYIAVMRGIAEEVGKPFHCTGKVYALTKRRFSDPEILVFFRDNFKTERLNKTDLIRSLIDSNAAAALPAVEKLGWLDNTKRRDELIEYAQNRKDRVECVAFLLDFKNRTADFAAEREKAEKKMMRELNASPFSVASMKKTWSFKKREDGTLTITNYKGNGAEVKVPEKIGKSIVSEIGGGAFAGSGGLCGGIVVTHASYEQEKVHREITKLTLPDSVNVIGIGAFADMLSLTEINIPEGAAEIGAAAFYNCIALRRLFIPKTVKHIDKFAFNHCDRLTVVVEKGSYAEEYCKKYGVRYTCKEEP